MRKNRPNVLSLRNRAQLRRGLWLPQNANHFDEKHAERLERFQRQRAEDYRLAQLDSFHGEEAQAC